MTTFYFFPDDEIALQKEISHHPALVDRIQKYPQHEKELILSEISAYCEVVLDGMYDQESLTRLCGILAKRLKERRPKPHVEIIQELNPKPRVIICEEPRKIQ